VLVDREGQEALRKLKALVKDRIQNPDALVFLSRLETPLRESTVLRQALHPALEALGLSQAGYTLFAMAAIEGGNSPE
jgi:hypothetical protein